MFHARAIAFALVAAACASDDPWQEGDPVEHAPPPGRGVRVEIIHLDGTTAVSRLETKADGTLVAEDEAPELMARGPVPRACEDDAFAPLEHRWETSFAWGFQDVTTPAGMDVTAVEGALSRATQNITTSRNDCGLADEVSAVAAYLGRIDEAPGIDSLGGCTIPDDQNVVGFGELPEGVLAVACTWFGPDGVAVEADTRLRDDAARWYADWPGECADRFSLEGVMTHERGHTFGLGHVAESTHARLTMSARILPCSGVEATLGWGDVLGLRAKY